MIGARKLEAEIRYFTAEEVAAFQRDVVTSAPVNPHDMVRDWNLLESALYRPRAAAYDEGADLVGQAATLLWGLIENHPFLDGNKRTAWVTAEAFLNANGQELLASDEDAFDLVIAVTQGLSVDEVEAWLRACLAPGS